MRKWLIPALFSLVILSVLAGCGQGKSPVSAPEKKFITITDSKGREAKIPCPPERIVAIGGSYGPETLLAFGVLDKIVGVADYAKKREDLGLFLNDVPDVGGSSKPSIEKILELKPDFVLAYAIYSFPELEKVLNDMGVPLVQMDFYKMETCAEEIRTLGKILNNEKRAEELIGFEKRYLNLIANRGEDIKPEEKTRVYLESYKEYQTVSKGDENHNAIIACGGINIFADEPIKNPQVSPEVVVAKNPDVIIKLISSQSCPSGYGVTDPVAVENLRNEIMKRPVWKHLNAVKNGKVYIISTDAKSTHSSVFHSYLAKWFYPERFQDLDPESVHREWMQKFLGIDLKGIYAYPYKSREIQRQG